MLTQYDDPCHGAQVVTQRSENRERSDFLYWPMWPSTST